MTKPAASKQGLKIVGVIGARAGSVGLPNKNIRPLNGKPLIAWIIEAAKSAQYLDRVVVSTDSPEYAEIAKHWGAEVPFLRPPELATGDSREIEYLQHAARWLAEQEGYDSDIVVRMQPTSPLQTAEDIDGCIGALLADPSADAAMAVAEARQHPGKALRLVTKNGQETLAGFISGNPADAAPLNRGTLGKAFFRANIVATRTKVLLEQNSQVGSVIKYYVVPPERSVDIDTLLDFKTVEALMNIGTGPR